LSLLYCVVPHFAAALARRDDPRLADRPLGLVGPEGRLWGVSAAAAAVGVGAGLTVRVAETRCPGIHLLEADVVRCRDEFEMLLQVLERTNPRVEPHGWGAAYLGLGAGPQEHADAVALCQAVGRAVREALGPALQPALGWDNHKFTAQAAARRTRPGHLLPVEAQRERTFLRPLPVALLPLSADVQRRLGFLGLRTLGQYAALPAPAVVQQFGRAGRLAQRCARGQDDRPVIPRQQARRLEAACELEAPLSQRERLVAALQHTLSPLLAQLEENLQVCGQVRLAVTFDDGHTQERTRTFLSPVGEQRRVLEALDGLLDRMHWQAGAMGLSVALEQIQEVTPEQLTLFPSIEDAEQDQRRRKLQEVQRYLAARFGAQRLRRAILAQPGAPLPEWRVGWVDEEEA
jgi:nucleotidyltransferase/DNA polymerase involved in DNA repair